MQDVVAARMDAARAEWWPGKRIGPYQVERVLGVGGMGVVLGMRHALLGRPVAMKILHGHTAGDREIRGRFIEEARAVNLIRHPNVIEIYDIGQLPDGRATLVMERLEGETLASRMTRERLPVAEAARILVGICDGLAAAHQSGVVHRDLKPDNVFLGPDGEVKIIDFGIAKTEARDRAVTTLNGAVVGTPAYMSPEQLRGEAVDHRTDLYALGCMAFELMTGKVPFRGSSAPEVMAKQLCEPPPRARDLHPALPEGLSELIHMLMAKDPAQRPALAAVRANLAWFCGATEPVLSPPAPSVQAKVDQLAVTMREAPALQLPTVPAPRPVADRRFIVAGFLAGLGVAGLGAALAAWLTSS